MSGFVRPCFRKGEHKDEDCERSRSENEDEPRKTEAPSPGSLWRLSSGIYSVGAGALGLGVRGVKGALDAGVGGVKWAAGVTASAGSQVLGAGSQILVKVNVKSATPKSKDKDE